MATKPLDVTAAIVVAGDRKGTATGAKTAMIFGFRIGSDVAGQLSEKVGWGGGRKNDASDNIQAGRCDSDVRPGSTTGDGGGGEVRPGVSLAARTRSPSDVAGEEKKEAKSLAWS